MGKKRENGDELELHKPRDHTFSTFSFGGVKIAMIWTGLDAISPTSFLDPVCQ